MSVLTTNVKSSLFTVCHTLRRLVTFEDPFDTAKAVLLNETPTWCYCSDPDISQVLMELPVPALIDAVRRFQPDNPLGRLRKNDTVRLIV
jgi:hypothetical protein